MEESRYHVQLEVFEGPLDLLYHLIKKNEVSIYDIPIARIADQYLETIGLMQTMNIDLAGDFLVMAATLLHIKSRMLLPVHDEQEEEDPRMEIVRPLEEYLRIKEAAGQMAGRQILGETVFAREPEPMVEGEKDAVLVAGLFDLMDAFAKVLQKASDQDMVTLRAETVSVRVRMSQIVDILEQKHTATFEELFESSRTRQDIVVTFLAILEMVKMKLARVVQHVQSGVIRIFYA